MVDENLWSYGIFWFDDTNFPRMNWMIRIVKILVNNFACTVVDVLYMSYISCTWPHIHFLAFPIVIRDKMFHKLRFLYVKGWLILKLNSFNVLNFHGLYLECLSTMYVYFFFYFSDSPKFVSSPQSYSGNAGAPHNFTCTATGHPVPKITWMFSSVSLIMKL